LGQPAWPHLSPVTWDYPWNFSNFLSVTTVANVDAPMTAQGTRFCPGSQGGAEWNGAAFDPSDNLIFTGEADWCTTVRTAPAASLASAPLGQPWSGATEHFVPPFGVFLLAGLVQSRQSHPPRADAQ